MVDLKSKVYKIEKSVDDHEKRLRHVENSVSLLPIMDEKLTKLVDKEHSKDIAVLRKENENRSENFEKFQKDIDNRVSKLEERQEENKDKISLALSGLAVVIVMFQILFGVDLSAGFVGFIF